MGNGLLRAAPLLVAGKPTLAASAPNCLLRWDMSLEKVREGGGRGGARALLPLCLGLVMEPKASEK